jgi:hypothetical protein
LPAGIGYNALMPTFTVEQVAAAKVDADTGEQVSNDDIMKG